MPLHPTPRSPVRRGLAAWALAAGLATLVPVGPARAGTAGPCEGDEGITVVVDFAGFRDEVAVRCAPAPVESGYDALTKAGFSFTPTQRFPGFLCRIDGLPADDPCVNTPPPDAYWGYWRAEPGGAWAYSQHGPTDTSPAPGPVEGWRFSTGEDAPPRVAPPAATPAAPAPTSTPEAPPPSPEPVAPTTTPAPASPSPPPSTPAPASPAPTSPSATASPETPRSPTATASPTATPSTSPSPTASPSPTPTEAPDAATAAAPAGGGPPMGTVVGLALVAVVGGGALWVGRRRRS